MKEQRQLTDGKRLARNSFLNLGTGVFIVGLNVAFVPLMLHSYGTELYGVLSATWMVLANLGWLDFGFSRATARFVAQDLTIGRLERAALWTWTAVFSQALLGLIGAIVLSYFAPFIVSHIHVKSGNERLVILTLRLFAFSVPVDFASRSMIGVLQAGQRFDRVNGISLFNTISTFVVYGFGIWLGADFLVVIYGLFGSRILGLLISYWAALRVLPSLNSYSQLLTLPKAYWDHAVTMIKYGAWIAFASGVAPLLLYFDQWIISFILGIALLPIYMIPFSAIGKLSLLPSSLSSTLFPAFSALHVKTEWDRIDEYFVRANRYLLTALIPMMFVLYVWAPEIFRLWLGHELALQVTLPFRVLIFGFGAALLAPLSGTLMEAIGRPDIVVKLYMVELPFNIAIVWVLVRHYGIPGAALSFTVRALLETSVLWLILYRSIPLSGLRLLRMGFLRPCATLIPFGIMGHLIGEVSILSYFDILATLLVLSVYIILVHWFVFDRRDKEFLWGLYARRNATTLSTV
ncbi:MAG: polysaccharide biosynthesis C-terminal domain-containing protein [Syntrophobacteraceae bacterium]